jgi:hypothetical protein
LKVYRCYGTYNEEECCRLGGTGKGPVYPGITVQAEMEGIVNDMTLMRIRVQVGDPVPSVTMYGATPGDKVNLAKHVGNKTVVLFGVPGAFTPGCSKVRCSSARGLSCYRATPFTCLFHGSNHCCIDHTDSQGCVTARLHTWTYRCLRCGCSDVFIIQILVSTSAPVDGGALQ